MNKALRFLLPLLMLAMTAPAFGVSYIVNRVSPQPDQAWDPATLVAAGVTNAGNVSGWANRIPGGITIPAASTPFKLYTNVYGDRAAVRTDPLAGAQGPQIVPALTFPYSLTILYRINSTNTGNNVVLQSQSGGTQYMNLQSSGTSGSATVFGLKTSGSSIFPVGGSRSDLALITFTVDVSGNWSIYNGSELYNSGSGIITAAGADLSINGSFGNGAYCDIFYMAMWQHVALNASQVRSMAKDLALSFERRVIEIDGNSIAAGAGASSNANIPYNLVAASLSTAGISNWPIIPNYFSGRQIGTNGTNGFDDTLARGPPGTDTELVLAYDVDYFAIDSVHIFMGAGTNDVNNYSDAQIAGAAGNIATALTAIHALPVTSKVVWLQELNRYTLAPIGGYDTTIVPTEAHRNSLTTTLTGTSAPDATPSIDSTRWLVNNACQNTTWFAAADHIHPTDAGNQDLMNNATYGLTPAAARYIGHSKTSPLRIMVAGQGNTNGTAYNWGVAWPTNNTGWSISGGSGASVSASVAVGGASATLTVNPGAAAGMLAVTDPNGTTSPVLVLAAMGSYTLAGPASGAVSVASSAFTVTFSGSGADGATTITLSDGGASGAFSTATTLIPPAGMTSFTFTYTPAHGGTVALSVSNSGSAPTQTVVYSVTAPIGGDYDTAWDATNPTAALGLGETAGATQALDRTSNHINSTSVGTGVTFGAAGLVKDGKTAAQFSGVSTGVIKLGSVAQFKSAAGKFAVAGWIKPTNSISGSVLANAFVGGVLQFSLGINIQTIQANAIHAGFYDGTAWQEAPASPGGPVIVPGTTYFIYGEWDGTHLTLAINGVLGSQVTPPTSPTTNTGDWNIGGSYNDGSEGLSCTIQKVAFWSGNNIPGVAGALALYNIGITGPTFAIAETRVTPSVSTTLHITGSGITPAAYTDFSATNFTITSGSVSGNTATLVGTPAAGLATVKVTHTPTGAISTVADVSASNVPVQNRIGLDLGIGLSRANTDDVTGRIGFDPLAKTTTRSGLKLDRAVTN